jgi:hypothetical protein
MIVGKTLFAQVMESVLRILLASAGERCSHIIGLVSEPIDWPPFRSTIATAQNADARAVCPGIVRYEPQWV